MLPPAAPTTQLSIERTQVGRPMTRSVRSTGRPFLITETFELVPPHSTTMPSRISSWWSAADTPAAGPEPIVNEGRRRNSRMLIAPPSPRRTRSGASRPASASADATSAVVRSTTGRMLAFTAALTVRVSSPYAPESSCPAQTASPHAAARSQTKRSFSGSSTANAALTATARHPSRARASERLVERSLLEPEGGVEEDVRRLELSLGCEPDRADASPPPGRTEVRRLAEADDADARHVALEQRVHRLSRGEGDELDLLAVDAREQRAKRVCDTLGHPVLVRVRRRRRRRGREARGSTGRPRQPS